jgi:hypothetical protein
MDFEWSAGRVHWRDVQRLELYLYAGRGGEVDESHWAFLRVGPGTAQDRGERDAYYKGGGPSRAGRPTWTATGVRVPLGKPDLTKPPLEQLIRFSQEPVPSPKTVTRADIRDLRRRGEWPFWEFRRRK